MTSVIPPEERLIPDAMVLSNGPPKTKGQLLMFIAYDLERGNTGEHWQKYWHKQIVKMLEIKRVPGDAND